MTPLFLVAIGTSANRRIVGGYYNERAARERVRRLGGELIRTNILDDLPRGLSQEDAKKANQVLKSSDPGGPERALYYIMKEHSVPDIADRCDVDTATIIEWMMAGKVSSRKAAVILEIEDELWERIEDDPEREKRWDRWRSTRSVRRIRGEYQRRIDRNEVSTNAAIAEALRICELDVKNALRNVRPRAKGEEPDELVLDLGL